MGKKISELEARTALSNNDIFVVVDEPGTGSAETAKSPIRHCVILSSQRQVLIQSETTKSLTQQVLVEMLPSMLVLRLMAILLYQAILL